MMSSHHNHLNKITLGGLLVTLGIIFGDIGTSPLYVLKAIVGDAPIDPVEVLGGVSAIFWTLTLQTTIKYVLITLRADNKGEGGIFSLFALVRRTKVKWLMVPAIIGGSTLLADGIITPPISVSSAVEGLRILKPDIPTIPIVITIIVLLFTFQQFGTKMVGNLFGPVMLVWFLMLAVLGFAQLADSPSIFKAINPVYAYELLVEHPGGFWLLAAVFLCTTGAEALYSDLGHCGKKNVRLTWGFVKVCLLLNYFGQAAWLLDHEGLYLTSVPGGNPFYSIVPRWLLIPAVLIATSAAVVASQAMISGSFTLINEAIRLNFWPKVRVVYPTLMRGQIYIPSINWLLMSGCCAIVLYFKESSNMEAAYGLAIITTMLMTTILLSYYMIMKRYSPLLITLCLLVFLTVELSFLIANLNKFYHGGWVTLLIGVILMCVMIAWTEAGKIKKRYVEFVKVKNYITLLADLSKDLSIPKYATHLVYLTGAEQKDEVESKVIYSILQKQPKRADIYWFVHVNVLDEPYKMTYKVTHIIEQDVVRIDFNLGFRVAPRINLLFRNVVKDLVTNGEVDITSRYESLNRQNLIGDFRFVVIEKYLSYEYEFPFYEKLILKSYFWLKTLSLSEEKTFGLDTSSVTVEKAPLVIFDPPEIKLERVF